MSGLISGETFQVSLYKKSPSFMLIEVELVLRIGNFCFCALVMLQIKEHSNNIAIFIFFNLLFMQNYIQ